MPSKGLYKTYYRGGHDPIPNPLMFMQTYLFHYLWHKVHLYEEKNIVILFVNGYLVIVCDLKRIIRLG